MKHSYVADKMESRVSGEVKLIDISQAHIYCLLIEPNELE
jgi:hypothetical protein